MGLPCEHTLVPIEPGRKKSVKIEDDDRWRMVANTWSLPAARLVGLAILFSCGITPATGVATSAGLAFPWDGYAPLPDCKDPVQQLFSMSGRPLSKRTSSSWILALLPLCSRTLASSIRRIPRQILFELSY